MKKILVIGSSNTDLIARVKYFPAPGETIEGLSYMEARGGKGANQALAAHRLGGDVNFITCLGDDSNGQNALEYYKKEGLDVSSAKIVKDTPSGTAIILVDESGENCIVINPGANNRLSPSYIMAVEDKIIESDIIVLQMEIPYETVKIICAFGKKHGKKVILNVAPARELEEDILKNIDILIVNEVEAETISGKTIDVLGKEGIVDKLLSMGPETVILTLGKAGSYIKNRNIEKHIGAFKVEALDTTAAGDTFCGALAARLSKNEDWGNVLTFASAASALCVTKMGAQPSVPTEQEVFDFLNNINSEILKKQL
jgi:ribokinase